MNYYQDSRDWNSMNNGNDDRYYNNEYYGDYFRNNTKDYENGFNNKNDFNNGKHSCCVRKVEETFCCFPSYYNEDKKEDKKEKSQCYEGTFKFCPKHEDYNDKKDDKKDCHNFDNKEYNNKKNDCYDKDNKKEQEHKCGCRCHSRCCGFCGLFRRW